MEKILGVVKEIKYLTQKTVELSVLLDVPEAVNYQAGQFMQMVIGENLKSYSIANPPDHNNFLKFCVGLIDKGIGSEYVKKLKAGDSITLQGPSGEFVASPAEQRPLCFVATGVGVAPFAAIIPDLLRRGFAEKLTLLFGLRAEEDVFYYDMFGHLARNYPNFEFLPTLTQPQAHWPGQVGRVTTFLETNYVRYQSCVFYVCGRPEVVKDVRSVLLKAGAKPNDIKVELFT